MSFCNCSFVLYEFHFAWQQSVLHFHNLVTVIDSRTPILKVNSLLGSILGGRGAGLFFQRTLGLYFKIDAIAFERYERLSMPFFRFDRHGILNHYTWGAQPDRPNGVVAF